MNRIILFAALFLGLTIPVVFAVAGTIDPTDKYAWSDQIGWINFGCSDCNVQVTDTNITGHAWSPNYGWINLNPSTSGITNSGGTLSGSAWGENVGWINFSGVTINTSNGQFSGTATGPVVGNIQFNLTTPQPGTPVTTDWRPGVGAICGDAICNGSETCSSCPADCGVCGGGTDETRTRCNMQKQCVSVSVSIGGYSPNECASSNDCVTHNECSPDRKCVSVVGAGTDKCTADADCAVAVTHKACNPQHQCISVVGPGIDTCTADANCAVAVTHKACSIDHKCIPVIGPGTDTCTADADCAIPIVETHKICNSQRQCVSVIGLGADTCAANADCAVAVNHKECNPQHQCIPIVGPGADTCQSNNDCAAAVTHNECSPDRKCVSVVGAGVNKCTADADCVISMATKHNECNEHKQCISVSGAGKDKCNTSYDCLSVVEKVKDVVQTPTGSIITKAVSTIGLVVAIIGAVSSFRFFDLFLILLRSFGYLLTAIGLRRRVVPWGVVYDSITKQPMDPAYVILKDLQGKTIASAITDLDGRYGFLVEPGIYKMEVHRTNYIFPSQKLAGKISDELYSDLYFGENIDVKKSGEVITKNIPLDSVRFDWNEFVKKNKNMLRFYSKWDIAARKFFDLLFVVGFIVAIIAFIFAPYPYNTIIMALYILLLVFRILGFKPRAYGYIADKTTGIPLSFAVMRVLLPDSQKEIAFKVADKYGKFYCLVPPGKYIVRIEKKNNDGSYSSIYTSPVIDATKKGIIKEKFSV